MRRIALVFGAALPLTIAMPALAEDVLIRIEAKRGGEAAQAAASGWIGQFPDVVTFPLTDDWVGIALGPMPREEAEPRLASLKSTKRIPDDSFISPSEGRELTVATALPEPAAGGGQIQIVHGAPGSTVPLGDNAAAAAATDAGTDDAVLVEAAPETAPAAEPAPEEVALPDPTRFFIRIESSADRAKADDALAKYREALPDAGMWTLPNGRLAVAVGPFEEAAAGAWLNAFKAAKAVPRDAFVAELAEMGENAVPGTQPEAGTIPAAGAEAAQMPALEDIQRALRWAGHYDSAIDGKDGPMTQAAIANEVVVLRASPDPATAMAELIRRREEWRSQMGLTQLQDAHTGLALPAPMDRLEFDRNERALAIYGPKNGSGAALILFSQPGGQQEMLDLAGLVTALGWVPSPEREVANGSVRLKGQNDTHIGYAEAQVVDGRAQGFVLIWPTADADDQRRIAAEISDGINRFGAGALDAPAPATDAGATSPVPAELPTAN